MRDWVVADLGPTMEAAGYGDVQIMVLDHNRDALPWYPQTVRILNNKHILLMEHVRSFIPVCKNQSKNYDFLIKIIIQKLSFWYLIKILE